jgi:hypothetical protein
MDHSDSEHVYNPPLRVAALTAVALMTTGVALLILSLRPHRRLSAPASG